MFDNRGMAVCLILATSRLGAVCGAIVSAYLLDGHCEAAFYLSGISLIGKYNPWSCVKLTQFQIQ